MIRLLAFDLDGTAILEHKYLSPGNRAALSAAREKGVLLVPATGRMLKFLPEDVRALPGLKYVITSNGAAVYSLPEERPVFQRLIDNAAARQVQQVLNGFDVYIEYYKDGGAITREGWPQAAVEHFHFPAYKLHFVTQKKYALVPDLMEMLEKTGLCPEKINLPFLEEQVREELWERLSAIPGLRLTSSIPDNIEINAAGADKGAALLFLAEKLGLGREELMAVGDNGNDVTMLQAAGCSVCVGDGSDEAKAAAKHLSAPHDADGLARAVERFVLND